MAFSPDGKMLASAGRRVIVLRSVEQTNQFTTLETDLPKITSPNFHPAGGLLAVAGGSPGRTATLSRKRDVNFAAG